MLVVDDLCVGVGEVTGAAMVDVVEARVSDVTGSSPSPSP
jgi:hypothetical protein